MGHPTGDIVLRGIAQQCMNQIRATDTVARYGQRAEDAENIVGRFGGEEFVIVLPETSLDRALLVAERLRSSIEKMVFNPHVENSENPTTLQVTVSIGVSSLEPEKDTLLDLLTRADHALYAAKETGRNRVCVENRA